MRSLIILCLLVLTGCEPAPDHREIDSRATYSGLHVVTIDGCQYLENGQPGYDRYAFTHKGNCTNPVHQSEPKDYHKGHVHFDAQ